MSILENFLNHVVSTNNESTDKKIGDFISDIDKEEEDPSHDCNVFQISDEIIVPDDKIIVSDDEIMVSDDKIMVSDEIIVSDDDLDVIYCSVNILDKYKMLKNPQAEVASRTAAKQLHGTFLLPLQEERNMYGNHEFLTRKCPTAMNSKQLKYGCDYSKKCLSSKNNCELNRENISSRNGSYNDHSGIEERSMPNTLKVDDLCLLYGITPETRDKVQDISHLTNRIRKWTETDDASSISAAVSLFNIGKEHNLNKKLHSVANKIPELLIANTHPEKENVHPVTDQSHALQFHQSLPNINSQGRLNLGIANCSPNLTMYNNRRLFHNLKKRKTSTELSIPRLYPNHDMRKSEASRSLTDTCMKIPCFKPNNFNQSMNNKKKAARQMNHSMQSLHVEREESFCKSNKLMPSPHVSLKKIFHILQNETALNSSDQKHSPSKICKETTQDKSFKLPWLDINVENSDIKTNSIAMHSPKPNMDGTSVEASKSSPLYTFKQTNNENNNQRKDNLLTGMVELRGIEKVVGDNCHEREYSSTNNSVHNMSLEFDCLDIEINESSLHDLSLLAASLHEAECSIIASSVVGKNDETWLKSMVRDNDCKKATEVNVIQPDKLSISDEISNVEKITRKLGSNSQMVASEQSRYSNKNDQVLNFSETSKIPASECNRERFEEGFSKSYHNKLVIEANDSEAKICIPEIKSTEIKSKKLIPVTKGSGADDDFSYSSVVGVDDSTNLESKKHPMCVMFPNANNNSALTQTAEENIDLHIKSKFSSTITNSETKVCRGITKNDLKNDIQSSDCLVRSKAPNEDDDNNNCSVRSKAVRISHLKIDTESNTEVVRDVVLKKDLQIKNKLYNITLKAERNLARKRLEAIKKAQKDPAPKKQYLQIFISKDPLENRDNEAGRNLARKRLEATKEAHNEPAPKKQYLQPFISKDPLENRDYEAGRNLARKRLEAIKEAHKEPAPKKQYLQPFISKDPLENRDNEDPRWDILRRQKTGEDRFNIVRELWGNVIIPDPNFNMTRHNRVRYLKGLCSKFNINPSDEQRQLQKLSARDKLSLVLAEVERLKLTTRKRAREEDYQLDAQLLPPNKRQKTAPMRDVAFAATQSKRCSKMVALNYNDLCRSKRVKSLPKRKKNLITRDFNTKMHNIKETINEAEKLHKFYRGLADQGRGVDGFQAQQELKDMEKLYTAFRRYYKWHGNEFCTIHADY